MNWKLFCKGGCVGSKIGEVLPSPFLMRGTPYRETMGQKMGNSSFIFDFFFFLPDVRSKFYWKYLQSQEREVASGWNLT